MSRYRIWFDDRNGERRCVEADRMDARTEGLFLDGEWQLAFDWNYWVPPNRIVLITKLTAESESGDAK